MWFFSTEAKQNLQALINRTKDTIADLEKGQGKLNKADKVIFYLF